tara:strand:+ start:1331 stop:1657 length:327 start_codon:yes stop_codon:yes gene_type:complete
MMRWITIGALLACVVLMGWSWLREARIDTLTVERDLAQDNLAIAEAREARAIEDQAEADAAAARDRARMAAMRAEVEAVLTTTYGGCADAPIDLILLDDIGELRRSGR